MPSSLFDSLHKTLHWTRAYKEFKMNDRQVTKNPERGDCTLISYREVNIYIIIIYLVHAPDELFDSL